MFNVQSSTGVGADEKTAESLNDGIIYLMAIPYILAAITAYVVYIKFFKKVNLLSQILS